jgi:hypothetical protein
LGHARATNHQRQSDGNVQNRSAHGEAGDVVLGRP